MAEKKKKNTELTEQPKKKPRGKNIGETLAPITEPGDNTKYLELGMKLFTLPPIDLKDPVQVQDRLKEFFAIHAEADMKPTVSGMGMALGLDRRRLWEIKTGVMERNLDISTTSRDYIKKAYEYMELLWENYMQNGKINPVSGIFLGKNNFGYQDKTEYVLTPNTNSVDYNAEDIKKRYAIDSQTLPTLDSADFETDS